VRFLVVTATTLSRANAVEVFDMPGTKKTKFDPARYMVATGVTRKTIHVKANHVFFFQGGPANSIFFLEVGRAKLTVVSEKGKEATVTLLSAGDFVREESLAGVSGLRIATATATTACTALRLDRRDGAAAA
jgi:CRP/FNR family transcriptional regulator, cyclic AMP receptor protein